MAGGSIAGDGATADVLRDEALMARSRLELPYGFGLSNTPLG